MSLSIQNNNINVKNSSGETVFDTSTPMPHITNILTKTLTHTFPDATDDNIHTSRSYSWDDFSCGSFSHDLVPYYSCTWNSSFDRVCDFAYNYYYHSYEYVCDYVWYSSYDCDTTYSWEFNWNAVSSAYATCSNRVNALDHSAIYDVGTVDANLNPDFILVQANLSRTTAGGQKDYGTFVTAIHQNEKLIANGSSVLESSFRNSGEPWLSRILNVYFDGNVVKAEFKHSNNSYQELSSTDNFECNTYVTFCYSPPDNISSTWSANFTVYVGKFTV